MCINVRILLQKVIHPIVRDCIAYCCSSGTGYMMSDMRCDRGHSWVGWDLCSFTYWGQTLASWPDGRQFSHSTYMLFFGDEPKIPLTLRLSSNGLTSPYFAYKSREGREEVQFGRSQSRLWADQQRTINTVYFRLLCTLKMNIFVEFLSRDIFEI